MSNKENIEEILLVTVPLVVPQTAPIVATYIVAKEAKEASKDLYKYSKKASKSLYKGFKKAKKFF
jgi:hypothetical protein